MVITEQNLKSDDILKQIFGFSSFRDGQEEIVKNILDGKKQKIHKAIFHIQVMH